MVQLLEENLKNKLFEFISTPTLTTYKIKQSGMCINKKLFFMSKDKSGQGEIYESKLQKKLSKQNDNDILYQRLKLINAQGKMERERTENKGEIF